VLGRNPVIVIQEKRINALRQIQSLVGCSRALQRDLCVHQSKLNVALRHVQRGVIRNRRHHTHLNVGVVLLSHRQQSFLQGISVNTSNEYGNQGISHKRYHTI